VFFFFFYNYQAKQIFIAISELSKKEENINC